ncbi:LPS export ABC transporter permease LptG [Granulosicoccaceae sp. 1_MG-2023]|nr:LPS export ABC transporter permease LptG [Granulosicoccaceae sp. 1_MG-2023]
MTSILDRYIGRSIVITSLMVLLVLMALAAVFSFIGELDDVGRENYTLGTAALYILLRLPASAYEMFAPAVLLGALLGLGTMATHSELVVMRAAGISIGRIIRSVLQAGVLLMFVVAVLGEFVAPKTEQTAQDIRLNALSKKVSVGSKSGLWLRSGERFINVKTVMPDRTLIDLIVYRFDGQRLQSVMAAGQAKPLDGGRWQLENITINEFDGQKSGVRREAQRIENDLVAPEALQNLSVDPEVLSARNLMQQAGYLKDNKLDSDRIQLALWSKLTNPLATLVMLMLAVPFVFGSQRSGGAGQKIFIGIMLGIGYIMLNRLFTHMGLVYGFPPVISAVAPLLVFFLIAVVGIRRTS